MNNKTSMTDVQVSYSFPEQKMISVTQFIVLTIFSFGIYRLCWIFQAWRFFLQKDQFDLRIAARTAFSLFYLYPLFLSINNYALKQQRKYHLKSVLMFLALMILSFLPEPLSYCSIFSFVFLILAFKQLNHAKINDDRIITTKQNKFSIAHQITITIGAILWILILFSILWTGVQTSS